MRNRILLFFVLCIIPVYKGYSQEIFCASGLYGLCDKSGKTILKPEYHYIWPFKEDKARVVKFYEVHDYVYPLYGYINKEGRLIVDLIYDYASDYQNGYAVVGIRDCSPQYDYIRPIKMYYYYIDSSSNRNNISFDFASFMSDDGFALVGDTQEYYPYCHPEYFKFKYQYLTKEMIDKGQIKDFIYWGASDFFESRAIVSLKDYPMWTLPEKTIINDNLTPIEIEVEDSTLFSNISFYNCNFVYMVDYVYGRNNMSHFKVNEFEQHGKVSVIDSINKITIRPISIKTRPLKQTLDRHTVARIASHGLVGLKDAMGNIIPCQYINVIIPPENNPNEYMVEDIHGWGLINGKGETIIPCSYDAIEPFHSQTQLCRVNKNGKYGFINRKNKVVIPFQFDDTGKNWNSLLSVMIDGKWGFINYDGEIVIPTIYKNVSQAFYKGYAKVVTQQGKEITIDELGNEIKNFTPPKPL